MDYEIKEIKGFEGYYVDTKGQVWSRRSKNGKGNFTKELRKLKSRKDSRKNYLLITLRKNRKPYTRLIHRLILETFISPCPNGMQTCHNNGIKSDNRLENLRWDTCGNNNLDKMKHGTASIGENHPNAKLNEMQVRIIKRLLGFGTLSQMNIAKIFEVSQTNISFISLNKTWKHI